MLQVPPQLYHLLQLTLRDALEASHSAAVLEAAAVVGAVADPVVSHPAVAIVAQEADPTHVGSGRTPAASLVALLNLTIRAS